MAGKRVGAAVQTGDLAQLVTVAGAPTTFVHGKKTVAAAGTEEALRATALLTQGVWVKALSTNTGLVFVGLTGVSSTDGYQLAAGETVFVPVNDPAVVFVDVAVNGEGVTYLGA